MVKGRLPEGEETTCREVGVDEKRTARTADQRDQVMYVQKTPVSGPRTCRDG